MLIVSLSMIMSESSSETSSFLSLSPVLAVVGAAAGVGIDSTTGVQSVISFNIYTLHIQI